MTGTNCKLKEQTKDHRQEELLIGKDNCPRPWSQHTLSKGTKKIRFQRRGKDYRHSTPHSVQAGELALESRMSASSAEDLHLVLRTQVRRPTTALTSALGDPTALASKGTVLSQALHVT